MRHALIALVMISIPIFSFSQSNYTEQNYPKWRAIGGIPAVRAYSLRDTASESPTKVTLSTLDAGAFGLSWGAYTHPDNQDGKVVGGVFDLSVDLLFFVSSKNNFRNVTFAPAVALGFWNNKLEFGVGYDYGNVAENSSRTFFVISASQSLKDF